MTITDLKNSIDPAKVGQEIYELIVKLFPICRSITGDGVRQTLKILSKHIPIEIHEVPSGTKVFDWTVPKEWNIRDAYVKNSKGEKIIDFRKSNLHVLNYSVPVDKVVSLGELKRHLFTLPEHPDWIPYRTSYYKENWGFCLCHNQFLKLEEGDYQVFIDSTLTDGSLTYGEFLLPGEEEGEVLVSCHVCHPSLANDNLSAVCLVTLMAKYLCHMKLRYSYRFLFITGNIGSISWLYSNRKRLSKIVSGLVVTGVGDCGGITYKKSRQGNAEIDKAVLNVLKHWEPYYRIIDFYPYGYDERQYCSPGFNLPVGSLSKTLYGEYPEYHTSADNLDFVSPESLGDSFSKIQTILYVLEKNKIYLNTNPMGEPQLGRRGLYEKVGIDEMAILWVLNLSDGNNSLIDISERSGIRFDVICKAAEILCQHNLLKDRA